MTAPELLPCPFCGRDASHNNGGGSIFGRFWWTVGCKTCDILVSDPEVWDKKNPGMLDPAYPAKWCFSAWNLRIPSPEVAALIAEARREERERCAVKLEEKAAAIEAEEADNRTWGGPDPRGRDAESYRLANASSLRTIAAVIRALKETTHD